jgi:metallo-beta-lactamase family protein
MESVMKITFCGAAGTTTGSQHLIEVNGQRILLDCGLYQGRRDEAFEKNRHFRFAPEKIDCVVLSHCHIDHSGNLPNLVHQGFRGHIYSTTATRDLCSIMLPDCAHIQNSDVAFLNKKRKAAGQPLLEPTFQLVDATMALSQFATFGYNRPVWIGDGVQLTFLDAGHVLGSAQVLLDVKDRDTGKQTRLLFSGDIGRPGTELLNDPEPCEDVDVVIMESTYGGRTHELSTDTTAHLAQIIQDTVKRNGRVIIPAFAVERTQQLLFTLDHLIHEKKLPAVATFVDSPLAVSATEIFRLHLDAMRPEMRETAFTKDQAFGFRGLSLIRDVEDSKELNQREGPAIIISASGMAESGRVLHHLRNNIGDARNTILFVGYCAEQTLGWKIRQGWKKVNILGEEYTVRARVEKLDSFSGHADQPELLEWFDGVSGPKAKVFLVHGETERSEALREALSLRHAGEVCVATLGMSVEV